MFGNFYYCEEVTIQIPPELITSVDVKIFFYKLYLL
jgi:hypothetical protein